MDFESKRGNGSPPVPARGRQAADTAAVRAQRVLDRLEAEYPGAAPLLDYHYPFELLIAVILSAQTTDAQVNRVTKELFKTFPEAAALADASVGEVERIIHSVGFYRTKARNIVATAKELATRFGGVVPGSIEELVTLPGVGRKSANVVVSHIFGLPGIIVDTHFGRVTRRIGLTEATDPARVESEIATLLSPERHTSFSMTVNYHGRYCCKARAPECYRCVVRDLCLFPDKRVSADSGAE